jgi:hypothetical protein
MIDRTGERFGRLVITRFIRVDKNWNYIWECKCDCGNIINVRYNNLLNGSTKSCGCLKREKTIERSTKHGLSGGQGNYTRLYRIWLNMRRRCNNRRDQDYPYYGGRGIKVCKEWDNYAAFHDWAMKNGYADHLTLDRINNNGDYCPENCRWATRKEQARNTRQNHFITFNGKTMTIAEWAEYLGVSSTVLRTRLYRGWPIERALTRPVNNSKEVV